MTELNLSLEDKRLVRSGEFGPFTRELLRAITEKEIGKAAFLGFSQGADVALSAARIAYSANLDTQAVSVGEPAGVEDRGQLGLGIDFTKSEGLKKVVEAGSIPVQKLALGAGYGAKDFLVGFVPSTLLNPLNRDIWKGLGVNTFETQAQQILSDGRINKLVVGYGSESAIAKPDVIEPSLQNLHRADVNEILTSIKVEGGKHTWGDHLLLLAKLYLRALE